MAIHQRERGGESAARDGMQSGNEIVRVSIRQAVCLVLCIRYNLVGWSESREGSGYTIYQPPLNQLSPCHLPREPLNP